MHPVLNFEAVVQIVAEYYKMIDPPTGTSWSVLILTSTLCIVESSK